MKNAEELRAELSQTFAQLKAGEIKPSEAAELANLAGKMIVSAKVQVEYYALRKESPRIEWLESPNARAQGSEHSERPAGATGYAAGGQSDEVRTLRNASNARVDHLQTMLADIWRRRMNDINDWKRYYGEERVKRAELEVATDELVEAAEMVLACIDQPRSRDNSEHTGLDAAEALRKATAEVKEFNTATLQYVNGLAAGDLPMVGDLVMLVARLARKLLKATPADELPSQALDYLNRNGLNGSPLREVGAGGTAVTRKMIGAAHDVMLAKGDFVLSANLLERIYLAMEAAR